MESDDDVTPGIKSVKWYKQANCILWKFFVNKDFYKT